MTSNAKDNMREKTYKEPADALRQAFDRLDSLMQDKAKKFNEKHYLIEQEVKRGGKLTRHQINL